MKVLHIIYTDGIAGAEKHLLNLLPGLKRSGVDCELMLICPPGIRDDLSPLTSVLNRENIKTTILTFSGWLSFKGIKRLNKYISKNNFSVVHSHLVRTDLLAALVKIFFRKNLFIISTKHGYSESILMNYDPLHPAPVYNFHWFITKFTLRYINCNISISHAVSVLFKNLKLTDFYFPVIHHGAEVKKDPDEFQKDPARPPQLLIAGRLEQYKGHIYVLKALPEVLAKYPRTQLLLIGEGTYRRELENLCSQLAITENVKFRGFQAKPYAYIQAADIAVVPSLFEPFGLVFIEAMALKTPVVAFDVPAGNEILNDEYACLIPKFDTEKMAKAIISLIEDPARREMMAAKAYEAYTQKFTAEAMVKNTRDFYNSLPLNSAN